MIGKKLKIVRDSRKLTMQELADEFNKKYNTKITISMISSWENERYTPSNKNISIYSDYFDIYSDYFLNDNLNPENFYTIIDLYQEEKERPFDYYDDLISTGVELQFEDYKTFLNNVPKSKTDKVIIDNLSKLTNKQTWLLYEYMKVMIDLENLKRNRKKYED